MIVIFVICVLLWFLFDEFIPKQPHDPIINYLPYINGSVFFLVGLFTFLFSFRIYKPRYKTVEQALKFDNLLRTQGKSLKFGSIFMILFGVYNLIWHDPNMYRLNSTIEHNKWTDKDRAALIKNCMKGAVVASKKYPQLTLDYCTCSIDKIIRSIGRKEYFEASSKSPDERDKIDSTLIQGCAIIIRDQIDSVRKQGK